METVLITGASRGIGLELTKQFLEKGYKVISTYRGKPSEKLSHLTSFDTLSIYELEVTDSSSIGQFSGELQNQPVDILINNAGIIGPEPQSLETIEPEGWIKTFSVNTIAPLMVSRSLLSNLKLSKNPRILIISSQMGSFHVESYSSYAYCSSKVAVNKVMQMMSLELKEFGIALLSIHPGWVQTDMGGSNATITVDESASGIVKLGEKLTLKQSGKFFNYDGHEHQW